MKVLYISNYVDNKYFEKIFINSTIKPEQNIQKFNKLLVEGLQNNSGVKSIDIISTPPINHGILKKPIIINKPYKENKLRFFYIPFINYKFIKQICIAFFSIIFVFLWCLKNGYNKKNIVYCDGFLPIISTLSSIIAKIFGIPVITMYTDINKADVNDLTKKNTLLRKIIKKIILFGDNITIRCSNMFIFLTKQMNDVINKKNKPYIVIECIVDSNVKKYTESRKNIIFYTGGLYEKYGVKLLIDSFVKWNNSKYELWLCGDGDLVNYIRNIKNKNVKYLGVLLNEEVLKIEQESVLLVNPRFSNEEYTKYSFPSKNMEYMLSGTPLLTTKLPGIPDEYNDYVYYIEEETEDGIIDSFNKIFSKKDFLDKGKKAQDFVINNKNKNKQANKIINFISKNIKNTYLINISLFYIILSTLFLIGVASGNVHFSKLLLTILFSTLLLKSLINYKDYLIFILFLISFFVFNLGQYYVPNIDGDALYYDYFTAHNITFTMMIQFTALLFSYVSYKVTLTLCKKEIKEKKYNKKSIKIMNIIIISLLTITGISSLIVNIEMTSCVIKNGYLSLYDGTYKTMLPHYILSLSSYFNIVVMLYLSINYKKKNYLVLTIFFINGIASLLTGARFNFVYTIIFILFIFILYYIDNKVHITKKVKMITITLLCCLPLLIVGLNIYRSIRNDQEIKDFSVIKEVESFFSGQGRSGNIITFSKLYKNKLKTNSHYVFGLFTRSLLNKVTLITGYDKFDYPKEEKNLNLGYNLSTIVLGDKLVKEGNGIGSNYLAELYVDGGIIMVIVYSIFLGTISCLCFYYRNNIILRFFLLMLTQPLLHISRSVAFELFAPFTSFVGLSLIILLLLINHIFKNRKDTE